MLLALAVIALPGGSPLACASELPASDPAYVAARKPFGVHSLARGPRDPRQYADADTDLAPLPPIEPTSDANPQLPAPIQLRIASAPAYDDLPLAPDAPPQRQFAAPPADSTSAEAGGPSGSASNYAHGYGEGLEWGFWGWLSYLATPQLHESTFWAWEAELDVTKSFTGEIAASADIDFVDWFGGPFVNLEQLFVSFLFPNCNDSVLTVGKFNAPFGIERHDFWDRVTGSASFVYSAQPRDLVGLMYTHRTALSGLSLRPFAVNGFNNNLDVNSQPSLGLMIEWQPFQRWTFGWTNWWGPEFAGNNGDTLYFTLAQVQWLPTACLSVSAEILHGTTESPTGQQDWTGYALIVRQALGEHWAVFGQWSDLNDPDGFIRGAAQHLQEPSIGLSWRIHQHVEARFEYRHDIVERPAGAPPYERDLDRISAHLTFGY